MAPALSLLTLLALAVATTLLAVQVRRLVGVLRWSVLVAAPAVSRATAAQADSADTMLRLSGLVNVEVYTDFACPFCRVAAGTLDSLRGMLGDYVLWTVRVIPQARETGTLSYRAALLAKCVEHQGRGWSFYAALSDGSVFGEAQLQAALRSARIDVTSATRCARSQWATDAVWRDMHRAASRGVSVTPTVFVAGQRLAGRVEPEVVRALIESLRRGPSAL